MGQSGKELEIIDREFLHALVARRFDSLEEILADDFVLIDLSGAVVSKANFLASLRSGELGFEEIRPENVSVRIYENTALVTGRTAMRGSFKGTPFDFKSRYTHVYHKRAEIWIMVAAQGTTILS